MKCRTRISKKSDILSDIGYLKNQRIFAYFFGESNSFMEQIYNDCIFHTVIQKKYEKALSKYDFLKIFFKNFFEKIFFYRNLHENVQFSTQI